MTTQTIVSIVFNVKPGKEKATETLLKNLVPQSTKESGCIQYDLFRNKENNHQFFMYQIWKDRAALDTHMNSPHIKEATTHILELLTEPFKRLIWDKV